MAEEISFEEFYETARSLGIVVEGGTLLNQKRTAIVGFVDEEEGMLRVSNQAPTYFYDAAIKAAERTRIPYSIRSYGTMSDF